MLDHNHITQRKYSTTVYMLLKRCIFTAPFAIFAAPLPHCLAKLLVRYRTIARKTTPNSRVVPTGPASWYSGGPATRQVYYQLY